MEKRNLTLRYSATQFTFWAAYTGGSSFATAYLLQKGIPSGSVGALQAAAGLLSCMTQPILANIADKSKIFLLIKMMLILSGLCAACFAVQLHPRLPLTAAGICYMVGLWSSDAMVPLQNALNVACNQAGYPVNYGAARGIGSAASAASSLILGNIIARFGTGRMLLFVFSLRLLCMVILAGYPKIPKIVTARNTEKSCSIPHFFVHYRWYCISLLGILFLGMYHAMTENYLIAIMGSLGGNSSHVGTALFISAIAAAPIIFCFRTIRRFFRDTTLLKIAAVSFLIKAILFYFARSVTDIYLFQLLQITSYAFLEPAQVFYANAKVRSCDMVKGQAFVTSAYALGCSMGNFTGGQLLGLGVGAILIAGIMMTLVGCTILFLTVNKTDAWLSD